MYPLSERRIRSSQVTGMAVLLLLTLLFLVLAAGCGGGKGDLPSEGSQTESGRAALTVRWPESSRLIPFAASSIHIRLVQGETFLGERLLVRPAGGGETSAVFERLPVGAATATATAYPNADGTGVAQASTQAGFVIAAGQTTNLRLTMASTIDRVEITPAVSTLPAGQNAQLTATAKNAAGDVVLTHLSKWTWKSSNPAAASVDNSGKVSAIAPGTAVIEATETESGKTGTLSITVPTPQNPQKTIAFQAPGVYSVPGANDQVVAGDFDADGNPDAAVCEGQNAYVLYGRGDGTLEPAVRLLAWTNGLAARAVADVDGNGRQDLILAEASDRLIIVPSLGGRTYGTPVGVTIGSRPSSVCVADFNRDGRADLAAATPGTNLAGNVNVVLNQSAGSGSISFSAPARLGVFGWAIGVGAGDWNGDGFVDLAATYGSSTVGRSGVKLYWGNGAGGFTDGPGRDVATSAVNPPASADFEGDGKLDLILPDYWDHNLAYLNGTGGGAFGGTIYLSAPPYPCIVKAVDLGGDGKPDIAVANAGADYITVFANQGGGIFAQGVQVKSGGNNTRSLDVADFNKDGRPDLVMQCESSRAITVLINATPAP